MKSIEEILNDSNVGNVISSLKTKYITIPSWETLVQDYDPTKHRIANDHIGRKDKVHKGGSVDKAARLYVALEKLLTARTNEFTFAIPVKRVYHYDEENEAQKQIVEAIEKIYQSNHIDTVNIKRGIEYYASCEILSFWYTKKEKNTLYGFDSEYKLKCKTFSPMNGVKLYPLFDEYDDLVAMSFEYTKVVEQETLTFFETYTKDRHYKWRSSSQTGSNGWEEVSKSEEVSIGKIPAVYLWREKPVWDGLQRLREDIEYTISRNSDVIAYNSAPVLKIAGTITGDEVKGETRRVYRVMEGGDVSYVSWNQSVEALRYHVDTLVKLFFMQSQMPDISFENLKSLGNIGYDSRKTLLADAHLKIGDESGPWIETFEREDKVIRAFLKEMNKKWEKEVDNITIEHIITPFIQEDEKSEIEKWQKANGGKPLVSHLDSIKLAGFSNNAQQTLEDIQNDDRQEASNRALGVPTIFSAE